MTPAERASLINQQEFLAECQAIRLKAYEMLKNGPKRDPRVQAWIDKDQPAGQFNTMIRAKTYSFKDQTLTLTQWSELTGIGKPTLINRLRKGWTIEKTLTQPVRPVTRQSKLEELEEQGEA